MKELTGLIEVILVHDQVRVCVIDTNEWSICSPNILHEVNLIFRGFRPQDVTPRNGRIIFLDLIALRVILNLIMDMRKNKHIRLDIFNYSGHERNWLRM